MLLTSYHHIASHMPRPHRMQVGMYLKKEQLPHADTDVFVNIFASGKVRPASD